ncbi:MAG: DUF5107 domain-containing protein [Bryobacteraceae bacterium]
MLQNRLFLATLLGLFCACDLTLADAPRVRAWQDSIRLPTYREGDADPNPQFSAFTYRTPNYPYPLRTNLTKDRYDETWRVLNLENEYLLCRVLPDLGGHLYSCRDKLSGREMFYANPVIRKGLIGLRGAWVALGIESNFPVAHARHTVSPVDFAVRTESDGSARAVVEDIDRVTGMQWRVEYLLRPASAVLEQRVTLYNRSSARRPYAWWANAGIELDDPGTRFVLPTRLVATHGSAEIDAWPISSAGANESLVAAYKQSAGWFAYGSREPFFAVYKPGTRTGVAHFADPNVVPGKKIWLWGPVDDGYVRRELTDNFPSYVEMQGGLFQNQETFEFLEPEWSRTFSEYWIPIRDLGGVSRVTRDAIVNLERRSDSAKGPVLLLELSVTHIFRDAIIRLLNAGQPAFETRADLDPARTYTHVLERPGASVYTFQLVDPRGSILLEHTENHYDALAPEQARLGKQAQPAWNGPETEASLVARGNYNELHQQWSFALYDYTTGLQLFPGSIPLQKAGGRLALGLNRFEEAADLLARVQAAAPSDDEAAYLLGVAQAMLGRHDEARRTLSQVGPASAFGAPAALQLACLAARAKDDSGALAALKPLLSARSGPVRPGALEVALLRRSGRQQEARQQLAVWRTLDPADSMLRFENTLLGADDAELWMHLAADSERVLSLVEEYLNLGMNDDALRLLDRSYPPVAPQEIEPGAVPPAQSPLIAYYRAYCRTRLGQDPSVDLRGAAESSTRYAFPSRPSSFGVLKNALQSNPSDATAHFLLGRWFMHGLMVDDAIAEWQKARSLNPRLPELYRDLGKALTTLRKDVVNGLIVLKEGLKLDPANPELRAALERAGTSPIPVVPSPTGGPPAGSPATGQPSPVEVASAAMFRAASGSPDEAARLFDARVFSAERQPDEVRRAYIEVQLQRLMSQARSGHCPAAIDGLERLGEEDKRLPFTFHGFNNFMKPPHFQYYLAVLEASCRDDKNARKRWTRVSQMNESLPSPEVVFPLLAAWRLSPEDAKPKIAAVLESVRAALAKAEDESRPSLMYVEAMLLRAFGQDEQAGLRLQEVVRASKDVRLQCLALLELREILVAAR